MNFTHKLCLELSRCVLAMVCSVALVPGDAFAFAWSEGGGRGFSREEQAARIPADQLDSLVAPIALYPDPLLAQVLAASTYPLEIIQLQQWLNRNQGLKDQQLADAVMKEPWDPSIQALAALPDVVKRLADDLQWTTDLGNAFLAQESDVMDAIQRMRRKAQDAGHLKTTEQQTVETKVVESKTVVVIEQANPQVVYVPTYNPVVVWGPPIYPYPPIYYPPPGYYAAGFAISFGVGVAMGAFWSGGWGWGPSWGYSKVNININNNFNRNTNINRGDRNTSIGGGDRGGLGGNRGGDNTWRHNPQHRGGAPYRDRTTADRFGGVTRGDSLANRQANARQQVGQQGGNLASNRPGTGGVGNRPGGAVSGAGGGIGGANRPNPGTAANRPSAGNTGNRPNAGAAAANRPSGGNPDRIGGRDLSRSNVGGNRSGFGGGSQGFNGQAASAASGRGSASVQSRGGGGGRRR